MILILKADLFILFANNQDLQQVEKMLGSRLPKAKQFSYTPHYYDPEKEKKTGHQIKFRRHFSKASIRARSLVWLLFLLALVIYLVLFFIRLSHSQP
jgi:cell wall assembly regulator SMI1